jgi:membrane protein DedA with SNARE-associated domain
MGGRPLINRLTGWIRLDPAHLQRAETAFQSREASVVLFGRLVPSIRTLISIPAGMAHLSFPTFVAASFIGAYVWCTLLIGLGYFLGHGWELFSALFKRYALAAAGLAGILLLAGLATKNC